MEKDKLKVLGGVLILELGYLVYLASISGSGFSFEVSPLFLEVVKHVGFQVVVLALVIVGIFLNGNKN